MTRARDVVEVIARKLVDQPDLVKVTEMEDEDGSDISVVTGSGDLGKLIGRQGRTATAVRTLATVAAEVDGTRAAVDFIDE